MKICSKCNINKNFDNFCKSSKNKDKLQSWCKSCVSIARMNRYYKNHEEERFNGNLRNKKAYEKNMQYIYNFLLEHPCIDCGEKDPIVLDFDHIDEKTKVITISEACRRWFVLDRIIEEMKKCEVRCSNCHRRRTAKQFGWYAWKM